MIAGAKDVRVLQALRGLRECQGHERVLGSASSPREPVGVDETRRGKIAEDRNKPCPSAKAFHISPVPKLKIPLMSEFGAAKMEGKKAACKTLPEDLVEKIVAMMPFPAIFKAKCLSKAWLARFLPISSQEDEEKKGLAILFQRRVREWSGNWETFYPVFMGENDFVAYDCASHSCRRMPSLSFLPTNIRYSFPLQVEGALVHGYDTSETGGHDLYVANCLTHTWKRLPHPPTVSVPGFRYRKLVTDESLETYKFILIAPNHRQNSRVYFVDIYDSQSDSWSSKKIVSKFPQQIDRDPFCGWFLTISCVYLDEVLYAVSSLHPQRVLAINLQEGTMGELTLSFHDVTKMVALGLTVWNGNVLEVVVVGEFGALRMLKILQIDMASLRLIEVARYPAPDPYRNAAPGSSAVCCSGSYIFFNCASKVLLYNLDEDEWTYFPFPTGIWDADYEELTGTCSPGLSPFLEV